MAKRVRHAFDDTLDQITDQYSDHQTEDGHGTVSVHTDSSDLKINPECGMSATVNTDGDDIDVVLTKNVVNNLGTDEEFDDSVDSLISKRSSSLITARGRHSRGDDSGEFELSVDPDFAYAYLSHCEVSPIDYDEDTDKESIDDLSSQELVDLAQKALADDAYMHRGVSAKGYGSSVVFSGDVEDLASFYEDSIESIMNVPWQEFAYDDEMLVTDENRDLPYGYDYGDNSDPRHAAFRRILKNSSMTDEFRWKKIGDTIIGSADVSDDTLDSDGILLSARISPISGKYDLAIYYTDHPDEILHYEEVSSVDDGKSNANDFLSDYTRSLYSTYRGSSRRFVTSSVVDAYGDQIRNGDVLHYTDESGKPSGQDARVIQVDDDSIIVSEDGDRYTLTQDEIDEYGLILDYPYGDGSLYASRRISRGRHAVPDSGEFEIILDGDKPLRYLESAGYDTNEYWDMDQDDVDSRMTEDAMDAASDAASQYGLASYSGSDRMTFRGYVEDLERFYDDCLEDIQGESWEKFAYEERNLQTEENRSSSRETSSIDDFDLQRFIEDAATRGWRHLTDDEILDLNFRQMRNDTSDSVPEDLFEKSNRYWYGLISINKNGSGKYSILFSRVPTELSVSHGATADNREITKDNPYIALDDIDRLMKKSWSDFKS